jgi:small subunit ribosomal protein S23
MENDTPKEGEPTDWQSVKERAYDQARKEFYKLRLEEDVERQVLREEALYVGAYFGKSHIDIGMELEEKQWQKWKTWALKEIERQGHERMAAESNAKLGTEEDANPSLIDALSEEEEATV